MTKNEYEALKAKIQYHSDLYYNQDAPEISDFEFDAMMRELKQVEAEHPEWISPDSPTQHVGGNTGKSTFAKIAHAVPMLSLQDLFSAEEVERFTSGFSEDTLFSVECKIDGLSMSATYENGILVRAETRGDGYIGEDITENARYIKGLPQKLLYGCNAIRLLEVRCEVYLPVDAFERINGELENAGKKTFANPRNAAAGLLRTKDVNQMKDAGLACFVFNVQRCEAPVGYRLSESHVESLDICENLGFDVVWHKVVSAGYVQGVIDDIGFMRYRLNYWIDGAVVKMDSINARSELGETAKYPRWAVAYKYPPEEKETVIRDIILQTGRTGRVTPVAVFDPVLLAGTTVSKATLHNPNILTGLGVNVGDTVLVRKAAEIIPEILRVVKKTSSGVFDIFSCKCPSCGGPIVAGSDENGDYDENSAWCVNPACPAKIALAFEHFADRDCMDIRGFGPGIVAKLLDAGFLTELPDIYRLAGKKAELSELLGDKTAANLLAEIEKSKGQNIDRFIKALGMDDIGRHIGKTLAALYPDMTAIIQAAKNPEILSSIDGIGSVTARTLYSAFYETDYYLHMVSAFASLGVNMVSLGYGKAAAASVVSGKTFVITGTLPNWKRDEAKAILEEHGAKVSGSVSKKTDYLLAGEDCGSKLDKAKELDVSIVSEEDVRKMLGI